MSAESSYGLYRHGLYSYGLYSYGHTGGRSWMVWEPKAEATEHAADESSPIPNVLRSAAPSLIQRALPTAVPFTAGPLPRIPTLTDAPTILVTDIPTSKLGGIARAVCLVFLW